MSKFDKWLGDNVPNFGGCLVAMDDSNPNLIRYYLIERRLTRLNESFFLINNRFSWDYQEEFSDKWKIIFKKVV